MRLGRLARTFGFLVAIVWTSALADQKSSGSGFSIGDGTLIVTANHVVQACTSINIPDVGPAVLLKSDPRADLAILKPNRPLAGPSPSIGSSGEVGRRDRSDRIPLTRIALVASDRKCTRAYAV